MYNSVPSIFKDKVAASKAAEAYTIETGETHSVMTKICNPNAEYEQTWYKPVAESDIKTAEKEGYFLEPQKYGCYCDLMDGTPDETCVIDTKQFNNCIYAKPGMRKEDCKYWRPIE